MENENFSEIGSIKLVSLYQEARLVVDQSRKEILSLFFDYPETERLQKLADHIFIQEVEKHSNSAQIQECQERAKRKDAIKEEIYKRIEAIKDDEDPEWQNLCKIGKRLARSNITIDNADGFFHLRDEYLDNKQKNESLQAENTKLKKHLKEMNSLSLDQKKLN